MHRIDTPTAQIDKFGPGKNGFTNGDPATGRRATDLNSDMWDAVQEEVANAIEGNGIALDKSKHNQLYLAIQKAITDPGFLKKANNLADLTNKATARGNLGLGTAATRNVGVEGGNVMVAGAFGLGVGPQHKEDAYGNAAEFFRVNATSANRPGNSVYGGVRLPIDGSPTSGCVMVGGDLSAWVGRSTTRARGVTWARVYTTTYKPTAADINAVDKSGDTMTGQLIAPSVATTPGATPWGAGAFSAQLSTQAPFFQPNWQWPVTAGGIYAPITKGVVTRQGQGYPTAVSFGYLLNGTPSFAIPCIHAKGDNIDVNWRFDPNSGQFYSPGAVLASGAIFHTDGNITGNIWGGYLSNWLNNQFAARDNNINTRATWDWVNQNFITNVRFSAERQVGADGVYTYHENTVLTGFNNRDADYSAESLFWSEIQIFKNGQWFTIGR
ncbi:hypothetical protein ACQUWL_20500 [Serratia marcescens]|uniref:hypothetical protein n=1 Tax=Serratia marcescens TaxID=615 RepID=UPI003D168461